MKTRVTSEKRHTLAALAALLVAMEIAWTAWGNLGKGGRDRGIRFNHGLHVEVHELDCTDCHRFLREQRPMPGHEICSVCHEIDQTAPDAVSCALCHTRRDYSVDVLAKALRSEVKFDHAPHIAANVDCIACHAQPDKVRLPAGALMVFCVECHKTQTAARDDCAVCHQEVRADVRPAFRGEARIQHDVPRLWERAHGHEFQVDQQFCAYCHEDRETFCEACHRQDPPANHTVAWRRKTHGLMASWDRMNCAVCHEEDSCLKCHQNTQPASHRRAGWGSPGDRHCLSCHFPEQNTNCTVCHEIIEHRRAKLSPHAVGLFPPNCARCHPGGNPYRAPHPVNSTVRCTQCHR